MSPGESAYWSVSVGVGALVAVGVWVGLSVAVSVKASVLHPARSGATAPRPPGGIDVCPSGDSVSVPFV